MHRPAASTRVLLRGVVDYAGLFPPASLSLPDAVSMFATHLDSAERWMLGRFVVPAQRLGELAEEAARHASARDEPWRVSALLDKSGAAQGDMIRAFNDAHVGRFVVDMVELRGLAAGAVAAAVRSMPNDVISYVELSASTDPSESLAELATAGARAKLRTGGVTAAAFPNASDVARFIARCASEGVAFKATAGLHHPLCGVHPLTYDVEAPRAPMFGFLNLFIAAVFAHLGASESVLREIVSERDQHAFELTDDALRWRGERASVAQIAEARELVGVSFGSCSFDEPVAGLQELVML